MRSGSPGERGYNLVALAMIVAVTSLLTTAAIPLWSSRIRRDKEEELIARGFQYAEAIRVFQKRFGRLPNRLEELAEIEPRSIRRLWRDPMSEGEALDWGVIVELPGRGLIAVDCRTGQPLVAADLDGDGQPDPAPPASEPPPDGGTVAVGPIHGVKSRHRGEAYHTLFDKSDIGDWEFTVEVLQAAIAKPGPTGLPPRANSLTIGRPFRYPPPGSLAPGTGLPGDREPPGGPPGGGRRRPALRPASGKPG